MRNRNRLILVIFIVFLCVQLSTRKAIEPAYTPSVYIWQRNWNENVTSAVQRSSETFEHYMVLMAEATAHGDGLEWARITPDWAALRDSEGIVTPVFRLGIDAMPEMTENGGRSLIRDIAGIYSSIRKEARARDVSVRSLQVDFDAPTSKLDVYREFLVALNAATPDSTLSITTLPTWMDSKKFGPLVNATDYFVLQVHSLEKPDGINDIIDLVHPERVREYVEKASRSRVPYYIALPTYGYQFVFDAKGQFTGLVAEQRADGFDSETQVRTVATDPVAMASLVNYLNKESPRGCLGLVWFRMPVVGDTLNWSWPTLKAVMDGRTPNSQILADIENPSPGLYEVWVRNKGESKPNAAIGIRWNTGGAISIHDTMNDYSWSVTESGHELTGIAPDIGEKIRVAWYRIESDGDTQNIPTTSVNFGPLKEAS